MHKIKYEVRRIHEEVTKDELRRGVTPYRKFLQSSCQDTELLASFDDEDKAEEYYNEVSAYGTDMGHYVLFKGKCLEVNEYNEWDEFIESGDWSRYDFGAPESNLF